MAGCCHCCCLLVVSCQSLSVVGRRLPFVGSFLLHRSLPVDICRIFLALPSRQSPTAPARLGFGQSMYIQVHCTHTEHVYVQPICCSSVKYCTCNHATVQLFSCATVQLFNCPTVQLSNLSSAFRHGRQELRLPLLSRRRQRLTCFSGITCIFRSICIRGTQTCRRHRMNVGYHCLPDCLANILRLSSHIERREKHKK